MIAVSCRWFVRRLSIAAFALVIVIPPSAFAQHGSFSLDVSFRDAAIPDPPDAIKSDGSQYVDYGDSGGRSPSVYANGNINIDLRGSSHTMQLRFDDGPVTTYGNPGLLLPRSGSYPTLLNSLTTATYGGITDLAPGTSNTFSIVIYWTGPGLDDKTHDYNVAFRQRYNSGVTASANNDATSWTIDSETTTSNSVGRVSVYLSGKGGGWSEIADYVLPFHFVATRHVPNLRAGGKK
jgi:hypothetical protein